ncbi:MAG: hypothetical protein WA052_01035 [Microgenomates group bacterium]
MKENRDLYFLRKIAEKTCSSSLSVEIGGQFFVISPILNGVEFLHVPSQERVGTNSMLILGNFLTDHSTHPLPRTDEQLYFYVVKEMMKLAVSKVIGISKIDMEMLIGSLAEYHPDDVEKYLNLLKEI